MTEEIAYNIGAFKYPSFYDSASWALKAYTVFEYVNFFVWGYGGYATAPFESQILHGRLREEMFTDLSHKFNYIIGRLSSYSVGIEKNRISVVYANSIKSRDRFAKWLDEILTVKYGKIGWVIKKIESGCTCPLAPGLTVEGDEDILRSLTENIGGYVNASDFEHWLRRKDL
jgi:hypothetical protein